ncbi:RIB43A-like with coiled-coils protein 2 [Ylistrum balloti]|uniref:RIB43A-like with coiled-coils protein 2 n=1 Tax=Ylistrum balloti TaxID=509963 RepID=UPI002905A211|nr:RIB43A-like with coiled-coils protein 2 [Ylistrum balloti]
MYKLDLPVDYKEAAAIERRKLMEEQRKSRIFNSKTRTIGVDIQAIEQQNLDKKQQEEYERNRDKAFASDAVRNDKIAMMLEQRQNQDVRELNKAVNEFRSMHQQPASRREFDLYDPDYLKKDKPARVSDDDPRCGISSLQKFEGEDLNNKARKQYQQEQLREWSTQQSDEKAQAKRNMDQANRLYELKMRELDQRAMDLANSEDECRRAINMAVKDYNQALDRERNEKERLQKQQEHDDNMTEIANHIFGDVLTENPSVAQSAFGPHRVITDRWKGMSPQQLEHIRNLQELQRAEKDRHDQEEELRNKEWERQQMANARAAMLLEREMERKRRDLDREQAEENRRLATEQNSHKDFLNKEVYTNPPTAAYFTQFNTTTR